MLPISSFPRRFATMKARTKTPSGAARVHLGARKPPPTTSAARSNKSARKSGAKAGMSSSANYQSAKAATATVTRFSSAEIEELNKMLHKAAPKTLESMSTGRTPLLLSDNPEEKREEIRRYFHATFDKTEQLFGLLTTYVTHQPPARPPLPPARGYLLDPSILTPAAVPQRGSVLHQARVAAPSSDLLLRAHGMLLRQQADPRQDRH